MTNDLLSFIEKKAKTKSVLCQNGEVFASSLVNLVDAIQKKDLNLESEFELAEVAVSQKAFESGLEGLKRGLQHLDKQFPGKTASHFPVRALPTVPSSI